MTTDPGVYAPQHDSRALLDALREASLPRDARVLDLCAGSGVLAIGAAILSGGDVLALDVSADSVQCARRNADAVGIQITVAQGGLSDALAAGPFDVVVCNPPYVPCEPGGAQALAWDAGVDGRSMLGPLCRNARRLLRDGGFVLIVHSEFSGPDATIADLRASGLKAAVVSRRTIDFGPVMHSRAAWLEAQGALERGRRREELVVIRGDRADSDGT
ncbi:methyltransferase [Antrihabitans cavernicola]|uniref:Methyltransferase n=1 Tax=Antrihabitans cavernicola TaxID=2495913 RepID=A0A5A7SC16_9NOCA|nr:HemK2/MTQ2 family protein methyltransferase [Spelaeibacter cavernicola]KAA0022367.1 methyltransferase [Spelaeibacter cavernicola]